MAHVLVGGIELGLGGYATGDSVASGKKGLDILGGREYISGMKEIHKHRWPRLDAGRKVYRERLNREYASAKHKNYQRVHHFEQRSRPYGDYLWSQDRDMFEMNYKDWQDEQNHTKAGGRK